VFSKHIASDNILRFASHDTLACVFDKNQHPANNGDSKGADSNTAADTTG
jgi:hypothetical protein